MIRTFQTHKIRREQELCNKLWKFTPLDVEMEPQWVAVPSCWETYPGYENYRGRAYYETTFFAEGNVRLIFKGISHKGTVYVDGAEVASHYNAYTAFDAIIKDLQPGIHELKVEVDNSFRKEYALNRPNDYMSYGGISRGVVLENLSEVFIENIHVTPIREAGGWKARIEVNCRNITDSEKVVSLKCKLQNENLTGDNLSCPPQASCKVMDEVISVGEVESWAPESPVLYEIESKLYQNNILMDDLIDRVGFRSVEVVGDRILLNERPIRIKGVNRHEDHPQYGCALPYQAMVYDLNLIRDLGANSVRTSHYPNDEIFLDLCDELGILVWEEHHLRGGGEELMRNPYFEPQCEQVIEEMIRDHYNHPSIYIWGIMNECASDTEYGRECYDKQFRLIRSLDKSRPHSFASCKYEKDLCMDLPDVASWNMYPYWYEDKTAAQMIEELYQWTKKEGNGGGKPFLITEVGAGAIYGFRSHDCDKWTEEYQADALKKQITEIMEYPDCMGVYIWQFCDIRVSREWFEKRPRTRNNKGIVDEFRRRKLSYETVKELFGKCPNYWD